MSAEIIPGDCLDVMRGMEDASVDAVVTDPPYGLSFMGKDWDHGVPGEAFWREVLRVSKPGSRLLAFGGTRTYHRLACAIEDAGWEIEDCLSWLYGSGFPKHKSKLKPAWEPVILARKPDRYATPLNIDECRIPHVTIEGGTLAQNTHLRPSVEARATSAFNANGNSYHSPPSGRWPANVVLDDEAARALDEMSGELKGATSFSRPKNYRASSYQIGDAALRPGYGDTGGASRFFYCAKASRSEREAGLEGTMPQRAGVGHRSVDQGEYLDFVHSAPVGIGEWLRVHRERGGLTLRDVAAHFPSRTGGITGCVTNWEREFNRPTPDQWWKLKETLGFDDRYDAVMTTVRAVERQVFDGKPRAIARNHHPTVKPVSLMRWLVRLITPPDGLVLDPFTGSGTTGIAATLEGRRFVGIEKEAEYVEIARRRIAHAQPSLGVA